MLCPNALFPERVQYLLCTSSPAWLLYWWILGLPMFTSKLVEDADKFHLNVALDSISQCRQMIGNVLLKSIIKCCITLKYRYQEMSSVGYRFGTLVILVMIGLNFIDLCFKIFIVWSSEFISTLVYPMNTCALVRNGRKIGAPRKGCGRGDKLSYDILFLLSSSTVTFLRPFWLTSDQGCCCRRCSFLPLNKLLMEKKGEYSLTESEWTPTFQFFFFYWNEVKAFIMICYINKKRKIHYPESRQFSLSVLFCCCCCSVLLSSYIFVGCIFLQRGRRKNRNVGEKRLLSLVKIREPSPFHFR